MADIAIILDVATALAVIVGLLFGALQIRQYGRKRQDAAAMELVHSVQSPEFEEALDTVMGLPENAGVATVRADPKAYSAVATVAYTFETFGTMVFYRAVPLHVLDHMIGMSVRVAWRKMRRYAEERRAELGSPNSFEWCQWLAERLDEHPAPGKKEGAHVAFRAWRP